MDEKPLFQNMDEQEAAYAPQETSDAANRERALAEEGTLTENRAGDMDNQGTSLPIPGPGMSGALNNMGNLSSSNTSPVGAVGDDSDDTRRG